MWAQGVWSALALALGSAALLNAALLGSLVWSEWLPPGVRSALWLAVAVLWSGSALLSYGWDRRQAVAGDPSPATEPVFGQALEFYLQGNWFEAERLLVTLLRQNPRDVDSRLLIATLLRHTGRWDEALRQLDQVDRLEASRKWDLEIRRERALIAQGQAESAGARPASGGPEQPAGLEQAA